MPNYMPPVEDVKRYSQEHGVKLFDAVKALRKEHNKNHLPEPSRYRFTTCKRSHTVMHQRYCSVCGRAYCDACQAEAQQQRNGNG